jgi:hypothetical protein
MITPNFILKHFYGVAPFVLDDFAVKDVPSAAVIDSSKNFVLTVTNGALYKVGSFYTVRGRMSNPFTYVADGAYFKITTTQPHNLTTPIKQLDEKNCDIGTGCGIIEVLNSNQAVINGDVSSGILYEPIQTEGVNCECISVVGNVVTLRGGIGYVYPCSIDGCEVVLRQNIISVPSYERALQVYTEQTNGKPFAFVVMGDRATAAKARSQAGIVANGESVNPESYQVGTLFDIVVFWSKKQAESNAFQIEEAYGRIYEAMNRIFFGVRIGGRATQITPIGSGFVDAQSDKVHYVHQYQFQAVDWIDSSVDGVKEEWLTYNEAVRRVKFDLYVDDVFEAETQQKMVADIELYEEL